MQIETDDDKILPFYDGRIKCKIANFYQPSTLSCVMEVEVEIPSSQSQRFILKLYDHRYATQLRKDHKAESFGVTQEIAYSDYVKNGDALEFLTKLRADQDFDEPDESKWNEAQNEVYLLDVCFDLYKSECAAYDRLKDLQGEYIPQLIAKLRLPRAPSSADDLPSEFYEIRGILLEHINGFTLSELADRTPREDWQKICNQAVEVVQLCGDRGILNEDVRASNVMIIPLPAKNAYRVVMLDFAQCILRSSEDSDFKWGRSKWTQDEEGAIGMVMQHRLKKLGFDLVYKPSRKYLEWASTEENP